MKILGLCLFLLLVLAPNSLAQESPKPPANNDQVAVQTSPASADRFGFTVEPDRALPKSSEIYCAYLRTYRVRREYRGSDVVSPAGYTTCVPSKRFELRSAVQVQREPAPRQ